MWKRYNELSMVRIYKFSTFSVTMKFIIYLGLIIFASQLSLTVQQRSSLRSDGKPVMTYPHVDIDLRNHGILDNSWIRGTVSEKALPYNLWPYKKIQYRRTIPKDSPIRLDYIVQYKDWGLFWDSWPTLYHDSVLLCDTTKATQDSSIINLVRELLIIPEGCPVSVGHWKNTSGVPLPLKNRVLHFNSDLGLKELRILTTLWYDERHPVEKIFTGDFYIIYPTDFAVKRST